MDHQQEHTEVAFYRSLIVHGLIALSLYLMLNRESEEGNNLSQPIELESVNASMNSVQSKSKPRERPAGRVSDSRGQSVTLNDLGMRFDPTRTTEPEESSDISAAPTDNTEGWDLLNPDPRVARFNRYVYNTVQGWLDRDSYMNPTTLTGTVKVRLWFDENGNYLENETHYEAIDPDFQKIVERALRKSFANPIPRPYLYIRKKFSIERIVYIRQY